MKYKRFWFNKNNLDENYLFMNDDVDHLTKVFRMGVGEQFIGVCGDEFDYFFEIERVDKKQVLCKLQDKVKNKCNASKNITLFQALIKGEKMEWIVQKITELGATNFIPFESEFCVLKGNTTKIERLNKISQEACKQCGRSIPLEIGKCIDFANLLERLQEFDCVLFANENEKNEKISQMDLKQFKNIAYIVGCEGGFSAFECQLLIEKNVKSININKRILRAETAAIALCANIIEKVE